MQTFKYDPNIHHRRSIRLKGYDYSRAGLYFITICCQDRICRFGDVVDCEMVLNDAGRIAYNEWIKTTEIRNNVELGEFIVMPNHIHGIIRLLVRDELHSPDNKTPNMNNNKNNFPLRSPSQTIGAIIRGYKSSVTKQINNLANNGMGVFNTPQQLWQRNYWERIIRNQKAYHRITEYILNNPGKWHSDNFFKS